jgi:hypothetical protein
MAQSGICPKCGGELEYDVLEPQDSDLIRYPVTCKKCEFYGYEYYLTTYNATTDERGNDM